MAKDISNTLLAALYEVPKPIVGKARVIKLFTDANENCKFHVPRAPKSPVTKADVIKIREEFAKGTNGLKIAMKFKLHQATVYRIINNRTWKDVS